MALTAGFQVGIVGGSIAGCAMATELLRLGCEVTIFERAGRELEDRGAGIVVPTGLLHSLTARGLIDRAVPHLRATRSPKIAASSADPRFGRTVWTQEADACSLTWGSLYRGLRAQVPDHVYRPGLVVAAVRQGTGAGAVIELSQGDRLEFDLVICADGYRSLGRRALFPEVRLAYAGYVLWRGLVPEGALSDSAPLEGGSPWIGLPEGTAAFYLVPGADGATEPGHRQVNWVVYVRVPESEVAELLTDIDGNVRAGSVPPGLIPAEREAALKRLARRRLPEYYAGIVECGRRMFLNAIYDCPVPGYRRGRVCLAGDAGALARPHTGAGALKGMHNCIALAEALRREASVEEALDAWDREETVYCNNLVVLGAQLGKALVLDCPDWSAMDEQSMRSWWTSSITASQRGTVFDAGVNRA